MNRETFVTLYKTRLFTADQVVDIVESERDKVLDELVSMLIESCSENYEPNGMGCKCCPFLIVYDDGLQCAVKELRQAGEP